MTTCAALVLLVVSAAAPSWRMKPGALPAASKMMMMEQAPPFITLPMPPRKPGKRKGGLPSIALGTVLGPAFTLSNAPEPLLDKGTPVGGRVVVQGTLAVFKRGRAEADVGVAVGLQQLSMAGKEELSSSGFDLLPTGRASLRLLDKLSVYGEVGMGLVLYRLAFHLKYLGYQTVRSSGPGFRLGMGFAYALSDRLSLVLEPLGLLVASLPTSIVAGPQTFTSKAPIAHLSISFGVTYRL